MEKPRQEGNTLNIIKQLLLTILLLHFSFSANAGALDNFESAQSKQESSANNTTNTSSEDHDDDHDSGFAEFVFELILRAIFYTAVYGGSTSAERVADSPATAGLNKRTTGEPLIPQYRLDYHFQQANAAIQSSDFRFEAGNGFYGFQARTTGMTEKTNNDQLRLNQLHALYRMSFGNHFGANLGIGFAQLIGNKRQTNLSMTFPVYFQPYKHLGFEWKMSAHFFQNAPILDKEYVAIFTKDMYSLRLGYRELIKTGLDITGPYVGFSVHY